MNEVLAADLDLATLDRIIDTLEPFLTVERLERIERALATRTREVVLVLEDIANEHNAAAVLRTAEAFGYFEVHVVEPEEPAGRWRVGQGASEASEDPGQHPRATAPQSGRRPGGGRFKISKKISKGADKWLDLVRHEHARPAYAALKARGYQLWASTLQGQAIDVHEIPSGGKVALVFGNELLGLSPEAVAGADGWFRIPMRGFVESFNISVAAAITCYDQALRRRAAEPNAGLEELDRRRVRAAWLARAVKSGSAILERAGLPEPVLHLHRFLEVATE